MQPPGSGTALQAFAKRGTGPKAKGRREQRRCLLAAGSLNQGKAGRKNLHFESGGEEQTAGPNHSWSKCHPGGPGIQLGDCAPALSGIAGPLKTEKYPGKRNATAVNWQFEYGSDPALTVHPPPVSSPRCLRFPTRRLAPIRNGTHPDAPPHGYQPLMSNTQNAR